MTATAADQPIARDGPIFGRGWWALVRKDYMVLACRRSVWAFQALFLLYLCAVLFASLLDSGGSVLSGEALARVAERMTITAGFATYCAALLVAPMLTVSALSEESESGMLEILQATPLSQQQLFSAIVSARLLLVWVLLFACVPLVAFPVVLGAAVPWGIALRAIPCIAIGTAVTMLFSIRSAASGESRLGTYWRLLTFVAFTPGAWGVATMLKIVVVMVAMSVLFLLSGDVVLMQGGGEAMRGAAFPFWGVGHLLLEGADAEPFFVIGSLCSLGVGLIVSFLSAHGSFLSWLARSAEGGSKRQIRRTTKPTWKRRRRSLQRILGQDDVEPLVEEQDYRRPHRGDLLLSTRRLRLLGTVMKSIYGVSRRNPFVTKEILVPSKGVALMWGLGILLLLIGHDVRYGSTMMSFYMTAVLASVPLGALLSSNPRQRADDIMKSTPITATSMIVGATGAMLTRCWFLIVLTTAFHLIDLFEPEPMYGIASYGCYVLALMFVVLVGLWGNLILTSTGQRVAATLAVVLLASLSALLLPVATPHPISVWTAWTNQTLVHNPHLFAETLAILASIDAALLLAFVVAFKGWWRRS